MKHDGLFIDDFIEPATPHADRMLAILDDKALVQGISCIHLVNAKRSDEFWFAPSLNYAVVKRVLVRQGETLARKTLIGRDFREVDAGLFLPYRVEGKFHAIENGKETLTRSFDVKVLAAAVNEGVPDALFVYRPEPGTLALRDDGEAVGYESGGGRLAGSVGRVVRDGTSAKRGQDVFAVVARLLGDQSGAGCFLAKQQLFRTDQTRAVVRSVVDRKTTGSSEVAPT